MLFRIASGQLLGHRTPVRLQLLEIPQAVQAAEGTAMEHDDCAFPLLHSIDRVTELLEERDLVIKPGLVSAA